MQAILVLELMRLFTQTQEPFLSSLFEKVGQAIHFASIVQFRH
jgi:hypothetical protein